MGDLSTSTTYQVLKADFKLMIDGVTAYSKTYVMTDTTKVMIRKNGVKSSTDYVTYLKYKGMKKRWDDYVTANKSEPGFIWINKPGVVDVITPTPTPTPDPEPTPDPIPTPSGFRVGYYVEPTQYSLTSAILSDLKNKGVTDVYYRIMQQDSGVRSYLNVPTVKAQVEAGGIRFHAWVWEGFTKVIGVNTLVDVETYDMGSKITYLTGLDSRTENNELTICAKPQSWDGEQRYDLIVPISDKISPMCYIGDYGQSVASLKTYVTNLVSKYGSKVIISLETYVSDQNTTPKSDAAIKAEIQACKDAGAAGVILFRAGLSNYSGGMSSNDSTTTTTPETSTCPDNSLQSGCIGPNVKTLQIWLNYNGFGPVDTDGIFDEQTVTVVKKMQTAVGTTADGVVGPITRSKMASYVPPITGGTTTGDIQKKIQDGTGRIFTTFTQFYSIVQSTCAYSYYYDDQHTLANEITHVINDINGVDNGMNCCDWAQLGAALAKEMGYQVQLHGVYCPSYGVNHAVFLIKGNEFADWTRIDLAAAASDGYALGNGWCNYPSSATLNPSWLRYEL
jgi:hypothetical protein